jgi:membrane protein involved in colicin uptake
MEFQKIDALAGMAAGDVSSAQDLQAAAMKSQSEAMDDIAGGLSSAGTAYAER